VINIDGILFRLIDTAGIRTHTADVMRVRVYPKPAEMKQADLVIYLFDVREMPPAELHQIALDLQQQQLQFLLVGNKVDPGHLQESQEKFASIAPILSFSQARLSAGNHEAKDGRPGAPG
jgi:tRNA modification GTPase